MTDQPEQQANARAVRERDPGMVCEALEVCALEEAHLYRVATHLMARGAKTRGPLADTTQPWVEVLLELIEAEGDA